jgi:uncharacterized protein YceK
MKAFKFTLVVLSITVLSGCSGLGLQDPAYDGYFNVLNKMFYSNNMAFGGR